MMATTPEAREQLAAALTQALSLDLRDAALLEALTDCALEVYVALSLTFKQCHPAAYDRWSWRITSEGLEAQLEADPDPRPH